MVEKHRHILSVVRMWKLHTFTVFGSVIHSTVAANRKSTTGTGLSHDELDRIRCVALPKFVPKAEGLSLSGTDP